MSVSLTILIFFPIVLGLLASLSPSGVAAWVALLGTLVPLIYAVIMIVLLFLPQGLFGARLRGDVVA